jgi:5'-3' exonuclease
MTIKHLWSDLLPHVKKQPRIRLDTFKGKTIGIDVSVWLHIISQKEEFVLASNVTPFYPPTDILNEFKYRHDHLQRMGIVPFYVFDGQEHPMKSVARAKRDKTKSDASKALDRLFAKGRDPNQNISDDDLTEVKKHMKALSKPTEELTRLIVDWLLSQEPKVSAVCAPFEAEWQLVFLEKRGVIDGIMTEDGDAIALGGKNVLVDTNLTSGTCIHYFREEALSVTIEISRSKNKSKPVRHASASNHDEALPVLFDLPLYRDSLHVLAGLLGCDYVNNIPSVGSMTILKPEEGLFHQYIDAPDKRSLIETWKKCPDGHFDRLFAAINIFKGLCPVYDPRTKELVPLNGEAIEPREWESMIGFSPSKILPSILLDNLDEAYCFGDFCFKTVDGSPPKAYPDPPVYQEHHNPGVARREPSPPLPRFAEIDFGQIPLRCCPNEVLVAFAIAHGLRSLKTGDRDALVVAASEILSNPKRLIVPPARAPDQIKKWTIHEILVPLPGEDWSEEYFTTIKEVATISDRDVRRFYPNGDENTQRRAELLFKGGNFDVSTFAFRRCVDKEDADMKLILFRCKSLPSMKNKSKSENDDEKEGSYTVYLCFDVSHRKRKKRRVLDYPYSCCGCPNGRGFCSHCLGFLMTCMVAQRTKNQCRFERIMPESPLETQNAPLLIELLTVGDSFSKSKAQKKRRLE